MVCPYDLGRFGGVQDQATKLTSWLNATDHEAVLIGPGVAGPGDARLLGPTIIVPSNGATTPISMRPRVWRKVLAAAGGCDVVHVHEPLMPMVSLQTIRKLDMPMVGTFHADVPAFARGVMRTFRGPVRKWVARLGEVTAVSPVAAGAVASIADVRIIPNGLDTALYREGGETRRPNRVMFLGRDDPRKGLDILLEAWPKIRSSHPDAELVVAGSTRPEVDGAQFLGRVSEEKKRSLLREAAVFVAPNLGGESFGIVIAEAMAAGCALVASDLPAFRHVLGDAGLVSPTGDVAALADAVRWLLTDAASRTVFQAKAAERVAAFDRCTVVDAYIDAYESAIRAT